MTIVRIKQFIFHVVHYIHTLSVPTIIGPCHVHNYMPFDMMPRMTFNQDKKTKKDIN